MPKTATATIAVNAPIALPQSDLCGRTKAPSARPARASGPGASYHGRHMHARRGVRDGHGGNGAVPQNTCWSKCRATSVCRARCVSLFVNQRELAEEVEEGEVQRRGDLEPHFEVIRAIMLNDSPCVLHEQSTHRAEQVLVHSPKLRLRHGPGRTVALGAFAAFVCVALPDHLWVFLLREVVQRGDDDPNSHCKRTVYGLFTDFLRTALP